MPSLQTAKVIDRQSVPAVVRTPAGVELLPMPEPVAGPGQVAIRVQVAGICRTDLQVADGALSCTTPRVLGHEFSGVVVHCGSGVARARPGDRVAVNPFVPCGTCRGCEGGEPPQRCPDRQMLGLDCDGAFRGVVVVPQACVLRVPRQLSALQAAYVEPLAAALAVTDLGLRRDQRGAVLGSGRIQTLVLRVMRASGFEVGALEADTGAPSRLEGSMDFVVETCADQAAMAAAVALLRPGGTLVVKSRPPSPVALDLREVVAKEITLRGAAYGSFDTAVAWLASSRVCVDDLAGPVLPLQRFPEAFELARGSELQKVFLAPWGAECAA